MNPLRQDLECRCPSCEWHGYWEDAIENVERARYGEAWGSPAWKTEATYWCPVCGSELEELPFIAEEKCYAL